jgi:hypothetical protein
MQEQNNLGGQSNLLQNGDGTNIVANPPQQQMDQWDLLDPVDILKKLPKDFQGKLASENWKERLECLEGLHQLLGENPRLSTDTQYSDIVTKLSRVRA